MTALIVCKVSARVLNAQWLPELSYGPPTKGSPVRKHDWSQTHDFPIAQTVCGQFWPSNLLQLTATTLVEGDFSAQSQNFVDVYFWLERLGGGVLGGRGKAGGFCRRKIASRRFLVRRLRVHSEFGWRARMRSLQSCRLSDQVLGCRLRPVRSSRMSRRAGQLIY